MEFFKNKFSELLNPDDPEAQKKVLSNELGAFLQQIRDKAEAKKALSPVIETSLKTETL